VEKKLPKKKLKSGSKKQDTSGSDRYRSPPNTATTLLEFGANTTHKDNP
jgi:hypothetical protein